MLYSWLLQLGYEDIWGVVRAESDSAAQEAIYAYYERIGVDYRHVPVYVNPIEAEVQAGPVIIHSDYHGD